MQDLLARAIAEFDGAAAEPLHRAASTRSSRRLEVLRRAGRRCPPRGREILAQAYELRGRAYYNIGLQEKAADSFRSLVQFQPQYTHQPRSSVSPEGRRLLQLGEEGAGGLPGRVLARRPGARVSLNGEFLALTDFFPLEVLAGEYTVEIAREGYRTETRTLSIAPQATETLQVELHAHAGQRVFVITEPAGVEVWVDGQLRATTGGTLAPRPGASWRGRKGSTPRAPPPALEIAQPLAGRAQPSSSARSATRRCKRTLELPEPRDYDPEPVKLEESVALAAACAPSRRAAASSSTARPWA